MPSSSRAAAPASLADRRCSAQLQTPAGPSISASRRPPYPPIPLIDATLLRAIGARSGVPLDPRSLANRPTTRRLRVPPVARRPGHQASERIRSPKAPLGAVTTTRSPARAPISARPTGDVLLIRPSAGAASWLPTIVYVSSPLSSSTVTVVPRLTWLVDDPSISTASRSSTVSWLTPVSYTHLRA